MQNEKPKLIEIDWRQKVISLIMPQFFLQTMISLSAIISLIVFEFLSLWSMCTLGRGLTKADF